jgi:transposase
MPQRHRAPYPAEFRQQIIDLVRSGRTPAELEREFEPSAQTISNWVKQADPDSGVRSDGLTTDERAELRRLRKENKRLKMEQEILGKAAAWFARESDKLPKRTSASCTRTTPLIRSRCSATF